MQVTGQLRTLKNAFSLLRDRALVKVEGIKKKEKKERKKEGKKEGNRKGET